MPFIVDSDSENKIVIVIISGKVRHSDNCAAREEAMHLCGMKKYTKMLTDLSELTADLSTAEECYAFGTSFATMSRGTRVALVLPKDEKARREARFTSNVSANRGLRIAEFETFDEAKNWLISGDHSS